MNSGFELRLMCMLLLAVGRMAFAGLNFSAMGDLPPGEQYRQLSQVLLISGGASPVLIDPLISLTTRIETDASIGFNPDDYKTPLSRIVDQQSMLIGAAHLLRFAHASNVQIRQKLAEINASNPVLVSMIDMNAIMEDVIIIRNAIADSISYSSLARDEEFIAELEEYRTRTIYLRNMMEYELFNEELERLTDQAIDSVGGKLDAYQRMFDQEVDSKQFDRHFDAAEYIYMQTEKFDERAGQLTEEIIKQTVLLESQVDP